MVDRNHAQKWMSALALGFAIGAWGLAVSASPTQSAQVASTVAYSTNELGMEFVMVPPGEFQMGCSEGAKPNECSKDEKPRHRVQITKAFEIGKTEVTEKQWQAVMASNPSTFKGEDLPVEQVTFQQVHEFLNKLNARNDGFLYRLPTEAEWEYAARAGTADQFAGAKVANSLGRYSPADDWAWYNVAQTQPVANKKPNAWGLYDMLGNVSEWTADWYSKDATRVLRGGSWNYTTNYLRVSNRSSNNPDARVYNIGFRCTGDE